MKAMRPDVRGPRLWTYQATELVGVWPLMHICTVIGGVIGVLFLLVTLFGPSDESTLAIALWTAVVAISAWWWTVMARTWNSNRFVIEKDYGYRATDDREQLTRHWRTIAMSRDAEAARLGREVLAEAWERMGDGLNVEKYTSALARIAREVQVETKNGPSVLARVDEWADERRAHREIVAELPKVEQPRKAL